MENFEEHLINKYPDLFYDGKNGKECPCGAWVPEGWEMIVEELCDAITRYTKDTVRHNKRITNKMYYVWISITKSLNWLHLKFIKLFPKYNKWEYNKPLYSFIDKFRQRSYKCVNYDKVYTPAVKIDQIKEKFGGLRFYYSGGDAEVAGMVRFAEYLCNKTCEVSGEKGELCMRGGWYKTLSPKIREEKRNESGVLIYGDYKPTK
jgi:hypothetical protein